MYKHPMLSVKEAAAMLGCDERWVRERLNQGQLKGEKKTIGMKEKWFVYKGEIDAALARKGINPALQTNFEPSMQEPIDAEECENVLDEGTTGREWLNIEREALRLLAEEMVKPLVDTIKQQTIALGEKDRLIQEQERQIRLLPDLQKQAESERLAAGNKALEVEALKKQITALEEKQAAEIEQERRTLEENNQAWKQQISALKEKQSAVIEQERKSAEDAKVRAAEVLAIEIARIKSQKDEEANAIREQFAALTKELQDLKQPWWKRWFATAPGD